MSPRRLLVLFVVTLTAAWGWDALVLNPMTGEWPWLIRQHGLYLTGIWSIGLMSLAMVLSVRPAWLETPLNGMDKIYSAHKWAGILGISAGIAHWLVKQAGSPLKSLVGTAGRPAKMPLFEFMSPVHGLAKDVGEWVLYALIFMLVISLWKRFPYRPWRLLHKAMPALYLLLVFHSFALMPTSYWSGLLGGLTALLLLAGSVASVISIKQKIGQRHRHEGRIVSVKQHSNSILEVNCDAGANWPGHEPGQFAFVTFDAREGAHPFTIASAPVAGSNQITFQIKALGDYTRALPHMIQPGQDVCIEGPYGRLDHHLARNDAAQIWVGGGIGITPFLAWLEDFSQIPHKTAIDFHYCVRDAKTDPFVARIERLCHDLPSVTLHVHDASQQNYLRVEDLVENRPVGQKLDVWYCGPAGLATTLRKRLKGLGQYDARFHQEAFEMR
jgi:predicted ferric reductase